MAKLDLQPLDLQPVEQPSGNSGTLDLQPLDLEPVESVEESRESDEITPEELQAIAAKRRIPVESLEEMAPFFGGKVKGKEAPFSQKALGFLSDTVGLGIPQKIGIETVDDPEARAALDDLRELAYSKKSGLRQAAEIAGDVAIGAGIGALAGPAGAAAGAGGAIAKSVGKRIAATAAAGATVGAISGAASSRHGEELKGAAIGGTIGAVGAPALSEAVRGVVKLGGKAIQKFKGKKGLEEAAKTLEESDFGRNVERKLDMEKQTSREADTAAAEVVTNKELQGAAHSFEEFKQLHAGQELPSKPITPETQEIAKAAGIAEKDLAAYQDWKDIQDDIKGFAKYLESPSSKGESKVGGTTIKVGEGEFKELSPLENGIKIINEKIAQEGDQFIKAEYGRYKDVKRALDILGKEIENDLPKESVFRRTRDFLIDGKYAYRFIDDRLGTNGEKIIDDLTEANNRYTVELAAALSDARTLDKEMKAVKLAPEELYRSLDTGSTEGLAPEAAGLVQKYAQKFEALRKQANELGVPIQAYKNAEGVVAYVPKHTVDAAEYIVRLKNKAKEIQEKYGLNIDTDMDERAYKALSEKEEFKDLKKAVEILQGEPLNSPDQLRIGYRKSINPDLAREAQDVQAAASFKRQGEIPDFVLEKDPRKLLSSWVQDTFRYAYLRDGIAELRRLRNIASAANDKDATSYIQKHLADLTGSRRGTIASGMRVARLKTQIAAKEALQQPRSAPVKALLEVVAENPGFSGAIFNQVYPNFLGFSPRAVIQNLTQPFFMTIPELGYGYGTRSVLNAYGDVIKTLTTGKKIRLSPEMARLMGKSPGEEIVTRNLNLIMENQGRAQKQWSTELREAVQGGMKKSALYKMSDKALEKYTNVAMALFEKSEGINRSIAGSVGERITADLMKGSKGPARFINSMPQGMQNSIAKAVKAGDRQEVNRQVTNYIISKTLFNYNRITMNEFGRTMGPIFSVFTKWPASVSGDILYALQSKGAVKGGSDVAYRYLGPFAAVLALENILFPDREESDLNQKLTGRTGLTGSSPLGSIKPMLEGKMLKPPVVSTVTDGLTAIIDRDPEKLWKWANTTVNSFAPGAGLVRFLTDDLPVFMGGEKPKGTFLNKALPSLELDEKVRDLKDK